MKIYEIKNAAEPTYFLRFGTDSRNALGVSIVRKRSRWELMFGKRDASDLRNFPDIFPVICVLDADKFKKLLLTSIVDAKYANNI